LASTERNILDELIARCRKGDKKSQFQLYQMYANGMLNTSSRIVGIREDAEDVVQDAFIKVFQKLDQLNESKAFGGWLKRMVINDSINFLKKKNKIRFKEVDENIGEEEVVEVPKVNYSVEKIKRAMSMLPEGYRLVTTMFLFENMSHNAIASTLNISESTSKSQYSRGRKKLQLILKQLDQ